MTKYEEDILALFKKQGHKISFNAKKFSDETRWQYILAEIDQLICQLQYYAKKYDEMREVLE